MFDFSQEEAQKEYSNIGPVPSGSIVPVYMFLFEPSENSRDPYDKWIKLTNNGLRQLYVQIEVARGTYADCKWRQTFTLPKSMQKIALTDAQETACRIGGSMLKAILEVNNKTLQVSDLKVFNGLRFFAKVKINNYARTSQNGNRYWVNEISRIIKPDYKDYALLQQKCELINPNGMVTGNVQSALGSSASEKKDWFAPSENSGYNDYPPNDEVPF